LDKIGQVINIFGSTGSGKTTLIVDSITFCLFGNAYGIDRQGTTKLVINPKFNEAKCEIELTLGNKNIK
jgi:ATPase involved in DNA repair